MQTGFGINMLALVKGQPRVLTLKEALECFIDFRHDVIVRRTNHELKLAKDRAHVLEGLKIALDHLDGVNQRRIVYFGDNGLFHVLESLNIMAFDRMGAFTYSPEEDTPAATMPDQIPEEIKQERLDRLMALQAKISLERNQSRLGSIEKVLVTGHNGMNYTARSPWEAPDADGEIMLFSNAPLQEGQFIQAKITGADTYDLSAKAIEQ